MKKRILLFAVINYLCFLSIISYAQNPTLQWAKQIGGTSNDKGFSIAVDASGNVYTTGYFQGTVDFDPSAGTYNLTATGSADIFVSKLNASGNLVWAKQMGGTSDDVGYSIAVDASGNVYTTGYFWGTTDFDPGAGTYNLTAAGLHDIFVSKLDASGNFVWAKQMGGSSYDIGYSIAVDASGNVYTTGYFYGTADFDPDAGTYSLISAGLADIFISKLDALGNFVWAKQMGGSLDDAGFSITIDATGNIYTTGSFQETVDFDPGAGTFNLTATGSTDIFVSKLNTSGNIVWAKNIGGNATDSGRSIAVDATGNVYTTGYFNGTADFDPDAGTYNLTSAGWSDLFVSKLNASGNFIWAKNMGGSSGDVGFSIAVDALGNIYTTGSFQGIADFDPDAGIFNLTSVDTTDIFISKLSTAGSFVWAINMGGTTDDIGYSIAVDASNNLYTTGHFGGIVDFDPDAGTLNLTSVGGSDIFVHKMSQSSIGINETADINNISIYPNPANDYLTIEVLQKSDIEILNIQGQLIKSLTTNGKKTIVDISLLAKGMHFVKVKTENGVAVKKFVKK